MLESIDHEWLAAYDDVEQHQLLKSFQALVFDHVTWYSGDILEVGRALNQYIQVKIGRDWLKRGRRTLSRHA